LFITGSSMVNRLPWPTALSHHDFATVLQTILQRRAQLVLNDQDT